MCGPITIVAELTICHPCALGISNGGCDGCESCAFSDGEDCPDMAAERRETRHGADAGRIVVDCRECDDCDAHHDAFTCDGCGTERFGTRHPAVILSR